MTQPHTVVIYHAECADGMAAAWATWKALGDDGVAYVPRGYADEQELASLPIDVSLVRKVIFVDFSWRRKALIALCNIGIEVIVLDHHKTAKADLEGLDGYPYPDTEPDSTVFISCTFDMARCGARLAWDTFHPGELPPRLVDYVEDRDLWRWMLPYSKEVSAFIRTFALSLADYDRAHRMLESQVGWTTALITGERVLAMQRIMTSALADIAFWSTVDGHTVPVANVPQATLLQSEVCEELLRRNAQAPFSAAFVMLGGEKRWSLRSRPKSDGSVFDVSALCKKFGGGGHTQAAGYTERT